MWWRLNHPCDILYGSNFVSLNECAPDVIISARTQSGSGFVRALGLARPILKYFLTRDNTNSAGGTSTTPLKVSDEPALRERDNLIQVSAALLRVTLTKMLFCRFFSCDIIGCNNAVRFGACRDTWYLRDCLGVAVLHWGFLPGVFRLKCRQRIENGTWYIGWNSNYTIQLKQASVVWGVCLTVRQQWCHIKLQTLKNLS
jgi:hypothetical protein